MTQFRLNASTRSDRAVGWLLFGFGVFAVAVIVGAGAGIRWAVRGE